MGGMGPPGAVLHCNTQLLVRLRGEGALVLLKLMAASADGSSTELKGWVALPISAVGEQHGTPANVQPPAAVERGVVLERARPQHEISRAHLPPSFAAARRRHHCIVAAV